MENDAPHSQVLEPEIQHSYSIRCKTPRLTVTHTHAQESCQDPSSHSRRTKCVCCCPGRHTHQPVQVSHAAAHYDGLPGPQSPSGCVTLCRFCANVTHNSLLGGYAWAGEERTNWSICLRKETEEIIGRQQDHGYLGLRHHVIPSVQRSNKEVP
eukprot:1158631-Pelagomonas_calceolata.AAC.5